MYLTLCKSKLHRATVTQAELHSEGSITIDAHLLAAAGIRPFERVQVVNVANGARFDTYAISGAAGSGTHSRSTRGRTPAGSPCAKSRRILSATSHNQ